MSQQDEYLYKASLYEVLFGRILHDARFEVIRLCKMYGFQTLLDIGCGTGVQGKMALSYGLDFIGIEASNSMLAKARARLPEGTHLYQVFAENFAQEVLSLKGMVNVAVCSLLIHEMSYEARLQVLAEAKLCAKHLIFVEYALPEHSLALPTRFLVNLIERMAGKRHYDCYRDFMRRGGIEGFIHEQKLSVLDSASFLGGSIRVVLTRLA